MLADAVVAVHFLFVAFVVVGGALALRWPRMAWLHIPAVLWGAFVEFSGWICPLTPLENALRRQSGQQEYQGDFIERYVLRALYPDGLTRADQLILGAIAILINVSMYAFILLRHRRHV